MSKVEKLAKQILDLGVNDVNELQKILEKQGVLLGITLVPDSWLREHVVGVSKETPVPDPAPVSDTAQ